MAKTASKSALTLCRSCAVSSNSQYKDKMEVAPWKSLQNRGKLIDRKEVQADVNQTVTDTSNKSNEDLRNELEELRGRLLDEVVAEEMLS